ncbi:MAG: succinate dehydrogenase, hydrophobic membrane anchor protein [bacterium]
MAFDAYRHPGGIALWFLQRLSALFLLALLLGHFYFLHYAEEGFVTYDKVAARLASPSWKVMDISFLVLAVFHAMNGLWTVVLEYVHTQRAQRQLLFVLMGIGFIFLGIGIFSVGTFAVKP